MAILCRAAKNSLRGTLIVLRNERIYISFYFVRVGLDKAGFISVLGEHAKSFLDMKVEKIFY